MTIIKNVNVETKANFYFDGKVTSRNVFFDDGSKKTLGINERLRVEFSMNKDGDNFTPPSFDGFRVVAGPSQSVSNMYVNGKRSFSKTYTYLLTPLSKGKSIINPIIKA